MVCKGAHGRTALTKQRFQILPYSMLYHPLNILHHLSIGLDCPINETFFIDKSRKQDKRVTRSTTTALHFHGSLADAKMLKWW